MIGGTNEAFEPLSKLDMVVLTQAFFLCSSLITLSLIAALCGTFERHKENSLLRYILMFLVFAIAAGQLALPQTAALLWLIAWMPLIFLTITFVIVKVVEEHGPKILDTSQSELISDSDIISHSTMSWIVALLFILAILPSLL